MFKRNSPDKNKACMGCVRETTPIKKKKEKKKGHGMCKRNTPQKSKFSKGCVRETPQMKMKPARDV